MEKLTFAIMLVILAALLGCNRQQTSSIIDPQPDISKQFSQMLIHADKDTVLFLESGSSISLEANSFVDAEGNPIKGEVDLSFREFQHALDIIATGITMEYDSAGSTFSFTTAGMFEFQGKSNGNPIFFADGKSANVNLSSDEVGVYNFYKLNEATGKWEYIDLSKPQITETNIDSNDVAIELPEKPVAPKKLSSDMKVFELDFDYKVFPELKNFSDVLWEVYDDGKPSNKKIDWIYKNKWHDVDIKVFDPNKNIYLLSIKNRESNAKLKIVPVLTGEDFDVAMKSFDQKLRAFENLKQQKQDRDERLAREGNLMRNLTVNGFGTYNCDIIYRRPDFVTYDAKIIISDGKEYLEDIQIFQICNNDNAVVTHRLGSVKSIFFSPKDDNYFVALLPNNRAAYCSKKKFKQTVVSAESIASKLTVELDVINKDIFSLDDLKEIVQ